MSGRRLVRALDLVDDASLIADYRCRHARGAVWPKVISHIRATGTLDLQIWSTGNRLFMIMEVTEDFPRDIAEPARVVEWERLMGTFQRPLPGTPPGEKWIELEQIFALDEYRDIP